MSEYDFTAQRVQRAYEEISTRFHDQKVKIETGARLIKDGILTTEDWNKMNKRAMELYIEEDKDKKKRQKEEEERRKQDNKPDARLHKFNLETELSQASEYIQTYPNKEEIILYLQDLKKRPLHYHSIFHGELSKAIQFIEFELAKREIREERTKTTKTKKQASKKPSYAI